MRSGGNLFVQCRQRHPPVLVSVTTNNGGGFEGGHEVGGRTRRHDKKSLSHQPHVPTMDGRRARRRDMRSGGNLFVQCRQRHPPVLVSVTTNNGGGFEGGHEVGGRTRRHDKKSLSHQPHVPTMDGRRARRRDMRSGGNLFVQCRQRHPPVLVSVTTNNGGGFEGGHEVGGRTRRHDKKSLSHQPHVPTIGVTRAPRRDMRSGGNLFVQCRQRHPPVLVSVTTNNGGGFEGGHEVGGRT